MEVNLSSTPVLLPPQIIKYNSYRIYLRDFYNYKKSLKTGYSYRLFAMRAGISSPNYLQLVILGKRNLSKKMGVQVAKAMGLSGGEKDYFISLIQKDLAKNPEDFRSAEKNMYIALKQLMSKEIPKAACEVISEWHHMVIREMVFLHNFQPDGQWISDRLINLITPKQAEESLNLLIRSGFLKVTKKGLEVSDPVVDTGDEFNFLRVLKYHTETLNIWRKVIQNLNAEERELGLISIALPSEKIPELKKRLKKFQDEIIGWAGEVQESEKDQLTKVVQVGSYLIPLTQN